MEETKPIKLKKRSDKTVFLDTVILGIVVLKHNLNDIKEKVKNDINKIWKKKYTYECPLEQSELQPKNNTNQSPFR